MPADTPMMKQYAEIKAQNPDCVLMFRLGDFYEMFGEDARLASKELDLVLTTRDKSVKEDIPVEGATGKVAGLVANLLIQANKV